MSTRGAICRMTPDGPICSYHHWDAYPDALGDTLWDVYHNVFNGDLDRMLKTLIDDHTGWSTINGADWSQEPGFIETKNCAECGQAMFAARMHAWKDEDGNLPAGTHEYQEPPESNRPKCYCHGERSEQLENFPLSEAAGAGAEWAYVLFPENHHLQVLSSYSEGMKMIGMFGMGDPNAEWRVIADLDLRTDPEPDWEAIQSGTWVQPPPEPARDREPNHQRLRSTGESR